jgi:lysophospholipase L1-like esterase
MRLLALAALLLMAAAPGDEPLPVHTGGRVVSQPDGSMRFGWPGIYFEARFKGAGVTAAIETDTEFFSLLVDGVERARMGPANKRVTIDGLAPGEHRVRLEKLTESQWNSSRFLGFWPSPGGTALPAPPDRKERIEFIGDSHSVGYGDTSLSRACTKQEIHDTTNTQLAFGPLVAKAKGAEYRVIAYSGYGIVRNYNGGSPTDNLPKRYVRAIPGEDAAANDGGWQPDWVVINLGTNDFSTALRPGEAWKTPAELHAAFRAGYAGFLRMLIAKYPKARFQLMSNPKWDEDLAAIEPALNKDAFIMVLATPVLELTGCDWHPSVLDQAAMADKILDSMIKIGNVGLKP